MVDLVERPGDAQLRARIAELENDFAAKCEALERVKAEHQKEVNFLEGQVTGLEQIKNRLDGRVKNLIRENLGKFSLLHVLHLVTQSS